MRNISDKLNENSKFVLMECPLCKRVMKIITETDSISEIMCECGSKPEVIFDNDLVELTEKKIIQELRAQIKTV